MTKDVMYAPRGKKTKKDKQPQCFQPQLLGPDHAIHQLHERSGYQQAQKMREPTPTRQA